MPHLGYKQTADHIAKRARFASKNGAWRGADVSPKGGRRRAERMYPHIGQCSVCGGARAERHHIDGNPANNAPDNVRALCRRCHMMVDGRWAAVKAAATRLQAKGVAARARLHVDTTHKVGEACPVCGRSIGVTAVRDRFTYIGCRKSRGGCGWNAGSVRHDNA